MYCWTREIPREFETLLRIESNTCTLRESALLIGRYHHLGVCREADYASISL